MQSIGLVIPTYNMAEDLLSLLKTVESSGLVNLLTEILVVDDASSDNTQNLCSKFFSQSSQPRKWKVHALTKNKGRFEARHIGAKLVTTELVLFIDTRIELPADFASKLEGTLKQHHCLMGLTQLTPKASIFDLYWERTHSWAFRKHYSQAQDGLWITKENFDQYTKGTGLFLCPRTLFLDSCESLAGEDIQSDDTRLLKHICNKTSIYVTSALNFNWHPRRSWRAFLSRLFERGPGFIEYHVLHQRGLYFYLFLGALIFALLTLSMIFILPTLGFSLLVLGISSLSLSTFLFAHSTLEAIKLMPLHVLAISFYFLGAISGLLKLIFKRRLTFE